MKATRKQLIEKIALKQKIIKLKSKFIKKPVAIEAFLWTGGEDQTEDPLWIVEALKNGSVRFENEGTPEVVLLIDTHKANCGDYIIRGIHGELSLCKPDIFKKTYYTEDEYAALGL